MPVDGAGDSKGLLSSTAQTVPMAHAEEVQGTAGYTLPVASKLQG